MDYVKEIFCVFQGKAMFYGLAQAICSCLTASPSWKSQYACAVVDALFDTPRPWLRQNAAGFLLFCSEALILHYFQYEPNHLAETVKIVANLI